MKYRVTIDNQTYDVTIEDLGARPVRVTVDGDLFEVWPETESPAAPTVVIAPTAPAPIASPPPRTPATPTQASNGSASVYAPIPGVIESVLVRVGDTISVGDGLCVLEAMKMKNIIRATRAGVVESINVTPGQQVKHHDILISFAN